MTLLICDDEMIPTQALVEAIDWERCGVNKVLVAHSALEARALMSQTPVQLLLCDIEMPGESGIQLLRWVRSEKPQTIVSFLSCHAEFEYARQALQLQSFDYLVKPARTEDVIDLVGRMIRQVSGAQQARRIQHYGEQWLQDKKQEAGREATGHRSGKDLAAAVNAFILQHISEDITVEMLAKQVFINPDHLSRSYKKQTGITINQNLIQERMALAARLLKEKDMSANQVAGLVGYTSYPSFVNMFKRVYGVSPSNYG